MGTRRTWSVGICMFMAAPVSGQVGQSGGSITRVDHFFAESASASALLDFLMTQFELPEAWPYRAYGPFESGGVDVGNVTLEVVRFEDSAELASGRFSGIALEPEGDTESALDWLTERGVEHRTPEPFPPEDPVWENTTLPTLIPSNVSVVFICDYKNRSLVLEGQQAGRALLAERNGGPLGILGVRDLVIESTDMARSRADWSRLLPQTRSAGDDVLIEFDQGPRIRIHRGDTDRFAGIVLTVRSIDEARAFLEERELVGPSIDGALSIDPQAVGGLRILITQAASTPRGAPPVG